MTINEQIIDYILKQIRSNYLDDIDLLVCYGSQVTGNATELSDVDLFYIPRTKNQSLSRTFILNGIGYDIFPLSWETIEAIASFKNELSPLLGDSKILHCYSPIEENRFKQLFNQMNDHLASSDYMQAAAIRPMTEAVQLNNIVQQESTLNNVREHAAHLLISLSTAVGYMNQAYFHKGLKEHYQELEAFQKLPLDFTELYRKTAAANTAAELRASCQNLVERTATFIGYDQIDQVPSQELISATEPAQENYHQAARWYEECSSTFNKIYHCGKTGNSLLAFLTAANLQASLKQDLQLKLETTDLLSSYAIDNLDALLKQTQKIQQDCKKRILNGNGSIREFQTIEELYNYFD